jgi:hypothetical protein
MKQTHAILIIALLVLTACAPTNRASAPTAVPPVSPQSTATATMLIPTPASPGDTIVWKNLQVTLDRLEITQEYETEYGSRRIPPAGQKFLWVEIHLKNTGQIELEVPESEHFSVLYAATELKPAYGHRRDYTDYTTLSPVLFPANALDAWLRFDVPTTAELSDLRVVFLPESIQVGTSVDSPDYPYTKNKPTFVWNGQP